MTRRQEIQDRYSILLAKYCRDQNESWLAEAAELGQIAVKSRVPLEEVAEIHEIGLQDLIDKEPGTPLADISTNTTAPLIELLMAFGLAFRAQVDREEAERTKRIETIKISEGKYRAITENTTDLTFIINRSGVLSYVSPSVARVTELKAENLIGGSLSGFIHPADVSLLLEAIDRANVEPHMTVPISDFRGRHRTGRWACFSGSVTAMPNVPGVEGTVINCRDISVRKSHEEMILHQANFDKLTGLPNRTLLTDRLARAIAQSIRNGNLTAIMFLDIDGFKKVNDSFGHSAGDELLRETGSRLTSCVRRNDTVARLGGDEFVMVLSDLKEPIDIKPIAGKILDRMSEAFTVVDKEVFVSASIGVTFFPNDGQNEEELLQNADSAMYSAKKSGRDRYCFYSPEITAQAIARMEMERRLRNAIRMSEFRVVYQPIVRMTDRQVVGAEALVRWDNPEVGTIFPTDFIPLAEETGLIVPLGEWVLETVCQEIDKRKEVLPTRKYISVNFSPVQFKKSDLCETFDNFLKKFPFLGENLLAEITENVVLNDDSQTKINFDKIKKIGLRVAMDDFGTGYSSLTYLKQYTVDILKIDRSFISDLLEISSDKALVVAIISLARSLDIKVIAEGIETADQFRLLRDLGCDFGQGYYFSRPMEADAFFETCWINGEALPSSPSLRIARMEG